MNWRKDEIVAKILALLSRGKLSVYLFSNRKLYSLNYPERNPNSFQIENSFPLKIGQTAIYKMFIRLLIQSSHLFVKLVILRRGILY